MDTFLPVQAGHSSFRVSRHVADCKTLRVLPSGLPEDSLPPRLRAVATCAFIAAGITAFSRTKGFRHRGLPRHTRRAVFVQTRETCRKQMSDDQIRENLEEIHGWKSIDMGSDGNCFFLSVAPQVSPDDVAALPARSPDWERALGGDLENRWGELPAADRAALLRKIAVLDEEEFITDLQILTNTNGGEIAWEKTWRAMEMFKDMAEHFISHGETELAAGVLLMGPTWVHRKMVYAKVREVLQEKTPREQLEFVLSHADRYFQAMRQDGTWAGTSEMVAISNSLGRPVAVYGNNRASDAWADTELAAHGDKWEVLPYFELGEQDNLGTEEKAIRIFSCSGHFQMLGRSDSNP
eukprot:TRINITY_DN39590_c0_g1_i1.p1 TRINITY_DN39590_c0_g1~~TRINITY_DN39590_c0_g1_i1.p1  ORF type:complete len:352 (+),score=43.51 TRINITY_DN39590_c0_g1_i1:46-1101(+)